MRFNFYFSLPWHWCKDTVYKDFFYFDKRVPWTKHKNLSIQFSYARWIDIFDLLIDFGLNKEDHAGPNFQITIFGIFFGINLYDSRHWDYDKNNWQTYAPLTQW